jgi:hypothetical protein
MGRLQHRRPILPSHRADRLIAGRHR